MNAIFIELTDGSVYVARLEPKTVTEAPLTDKEKVILDLHRQLEALKNKPKKYKATYNLKNPPLPPKDREISLGGAGRKKN